MIFLGLLLGRDDRVVELGWADRSRRWWLPRCFCVDPNFLAHAPLVKADVATALLLLSLMMSIWLLGERATIARIGGGSPCCWAR